MTPEDDPLFPVCPEDCNNVRWCSHIRAYLLENRDSPNITPGIRVCVPMWPEAGVFAEASIDTKEIAGAAAKLALVKKDMFTSDEELIELGLWTKGEGRMVLTGIIQDWLRTSTYGVPLNCPSRSHNFREEEALKRNAGTKAARMEWWFILIHGMCKSCYDKTAAIVGANSGFGLSGVTQQTAQQSQTMSALRSRSF